MQLFLVRLADYLLFDLSVCDTSKGGQTTLDGCQNGLLKSPEDGWGVSSRLYSCSMILHFGEVFWYFISLFECISLCLDHLFGEGRFQQGTLKVAPLGSSSTKTDTDRKMLYTTLFFRGDSLSTSHFFTQ